MPILWERILKSTRWGTIAQEESKYGSLVTESGASRQTCFTEIGYLICDLNGSVAKVIAAFIQTMHGKHWAGAFCHKSMS